MIYGRGREDIRRVFVDVWQRHARNEQLPAFERSVAAVIDAHPEYQPLLDDPEIVERDFSVEAGTTNPFLHMGMHMTIAEQLTTNRPAGIRETYSALIPVYGDAHSVEHAIMDCLAECLWEAQRRARPPDELRYLQCVRRLAAKGAG